MEKCWMPYCVRRRRVWMLPCARRHRAGTWVRWIGSWSLARICLHVILRMAGPFCTGRLLQEACLCAICCSKRVYPGLD